MKVVKSKRKSTMRLGKVVYKIEYTVDLNNKDMVDHAKECIAEDVDAAVKYNEVYDSIDVIRDPKAKVSNIPDFLMEDHGGVNEN
jgi:hypothetical protein